MQHALESLKSKEEYALSIAVKQIPHRKVVSLRSVIRRFQDEGLLWETLDKECKKHNIKPSSTGYSYAIRHEIDLSIPYIDVEVQRVVDKLGSDNDKIKYYEVPECEAAVVAFQGVYNKLTNINVSIANWVCENGYKPCSQAFLIYYISPGNESDSKNFITEVCFPIKKYKNN